MCNEIFGPEKQIICQFLVKKGKGKVITLNTKLVQFITAWNWQSNNLHTPSYVIKNLKLKRKTFQYSYELEGKQKWKTFKICLQVTERGWQSSSGVEQQ